VALAREAYDAWIERVLGVRPPASPPGASLGASGGTEVAPTDIAGALAG
jgi:hypothetical protein